MSWKSSMSARKSVVFRTWDVSSPTEARMASRLSSAISVCSATDSGIILVFGSIPSCPEMKRRFWNRTACE